MILSRSFHQPVSISPEEIVHRLERLRIHPGTHVDENGKFEIFFGDQRIAAPLVARGQVQNGILEGDVSLSGRAWAALIAALILNVTVLPYFAAQSLFWIGLFAAFDVILWRRYTHYYYQSQDFLSIIQTGLI